MTRIERIKNTLADLDPTYISITDDSHKHHIPKSLKNAQTHITLILVSQMFDNMSLIKRHQLIYKRLQQEYTADNISIKLHALSLHLYTPKEWEHEQDKTKKAPPCRDGFQAG